MPVAIGKFVAVGAALFRLKRPLEPTVDGRIKMRSKAMARRLKGGDGLLPAPNVKLAADAASICRTCRYKSFIKGSLGRFVPLVPQAEFSEPLTDFVTRDAEQLAKLSLREIFTHFPPFASK